MKRAATHLLNRQSAYLLRFFQNYRTFTLILDPPVQNRGVKTRPQGQLECANPRGRPGGGQAWN